MSASLCSDTEIALLEIELELALRVLIAQFGGDDMSQEQAETLLRHARRDAEHFIVGYTPACIERQSAIREYRSGALVLH